MSREIKLGAFALVVIFMAIWGYTFLKGKDLFGDSMTFKTTYKNVTQLTKSSPVYINGFKVGTVFNITPNPDNLREMVVTFEVQGDYKVPKTAIVGLISDGFVGGKALSINLEILCSGSDCAEDGDMLAGKSISLIESIVGDPGEIKEYASVFGDELGNVIERLGQEDSKGSLNITLRELQKTMENMSAITETTSKILTNSSHNLTKTIKNMSDITANLAANNAQITAMLSNMTDITTQIKDANVGSTITATNTTLEEAQKSIVLLQSTIENSDKVMKNLDNVLTKANSGDGTLAKLLNDKQLYSNLEMTTKNLSLLLQDLRLNPSRYVKVSVFGGKNKDPYINPENDPAFKN